jgi:hypothetical protein
MMLNTLFILHPRIRTENSNLESNSYVGTEFPNYKHIQTNNLHSNYYLMTYQGYSESKVQTGAIGGNEVELWHQNVVRGQ